MLKVIYFIFCLLSIFNGGWMLLFPLSWYTDLPAAVPNTGPFNQHFVRDLGVVFLLIGLAFGWAALNVDRSRPVHLVVTAFFTGHAMIHVADIVTGRLPHRHWMIDMPGVFVPAVLMIILAVPTVRRRLGGN